MKRYILMIAFGAIGIALSAGAVHQLRADTLPGDSELCYHNLWTCSNVDNDGYWSQCNPSGTGLITTAAAKGICDKYNLP